ncbi:protein translocase subunit SecA-like [Simochromis diagramma]|uniref:protein translocase subunit SecA-like n=1 Tax=Simochromis diagramma TaxID=43689 RepID=UPI001A7EDA38|nr:protein translocase subunit SecA-like [Simochromis diagramma]
MSTDFSYLIKKMDDDEEILLKTLKALVTNIKWSPKEVADLFDALLKRFESSVNDKSHLLMGMIKMLHCIEIHFITSDWKNEDGKTLLELLQEKTVTDETLKEYLASDRLKSLEEILDEIRQEKLNQIDKNILNDVRDIVSTVHEGRDIPEDGSQKSELKTILKKLCLAVEKTKTKNIKKPFRPRLTQMVSWCLMALSETGRLIQVGTGEGKSCIVAMFAAFRALRGEKVDIMSSSSVLAERDCKEWEGFYKELNITADYNCNRPDVELKKCYECQVVYGTAENFAGDWLRHHFQRLDILGQRKFQCAVVDEVDSLMLDKGHHVVYLSSNMPALQHLNPLLACIWATVNQYKKTGTYTTVGPKYPFYQVLENMMDKDGDESIIRQIAEDTGILLKGSVKDLRKNPSLLNEMTKSATADQLAEFFKMMERKFPSSQFALSLINNSGKIQELCKELQSEHEESRRVSLLLLDGGFCQYMYSDHDSVVRAVEEEVKRSIHFTPCELNQAKSSCYVPGFFSELLKSKLKVWIENAFKAQLMTEDHEYVMEKHGIVPVDYSCTGVVENNMKWTDGLQQFIEMKHESKISDMTAITNYMSNVGLLQKYKNQFGSQIYGMSGTLGQEKETETLQKIYDGIKTCQIPSFKRRKLFEVEGVVVEDEKEWIKQICDVVIVQTSPTSYRDPRAVLIICETIKRAKMIHRSLGDRVTNKTLYINNNMDNSVIISKEFKAGEVIIATNLAGRGTDLQVSDTVKEAGGLFVVQTFLPKNARVEVQAFGRTARQGSPGSAQLIVCLSHLAESLQLLLSIRKLYSLLRSLTDVRPLKQFRFVMQLRLYKQSNSNKASAEMSSMLKDILSGTSQQEVKIIKQVRDSTVADELSSYLESQIPDMKKKEELFNDYLDVLDDVYTSSNNKPGASDLSALNEFWGMWLLTSFSAKDSTEELKSRLKTDLDTARQKLRRRESPSSNLYHYISFGNDLCEKGKFAESINMYTKAIQKDHCWGAIAYYNRALTSLKQQNRRQSPDCIDRALEDLQNALKSVQLHCDQLEVTHRFLTQHTKNNNSASLTRLDKHFMARCTVLESFKINITEAIKKVDRARDTGGNVKVEESLVFFMVPLVHFLPFMIHLRESVPVIRSRDPLMCRQLISHPSFDILNELESLKSLGLTHVYTLDTLFSLGGFFSKITRKIMKTI